MSERIKGHNKDIELLNKLAAAISKNPYKVYSEFIAIYNDADDADDIEELIEFGDVYGYFSYSNSWPNINISVGGASGNATVYVKSDNIGYCSEYNFFSFIEKMIKGIWDTISEIEKEIERLEKANLPELLPFELELLDGNYKFPSFNVAVFKKNYGNMGDCDKDVMTLNLSCPQRHYLTKEVPTEMSKDIGKIFLTLLQEAREKQQLTITELDAEIAKITELLKEKV